MSKGTTDFLRLLSLAKEYTNCSSEEIEQFRERHRLEWVKKPNHRKKRSPDLDPVLLYSQERGYSVLISEAVGG